MLIHNKNDKSDTSKESGFVLVLALVMLLVLSLLGAWALNTSTSEIQVASGSQRIERQFNIAEGATYSESGKVGFVLKPFYAISDPGRAYQILIPPTDATFDPGNDTAVTRAAIAAQKLVYTNPSANVPIATWPFENMLLNYDNNPVNTDEYDYRYLTIYLHKDSPPLGYDASLFAGYKFSLQSATVDRPLSIEVGGTKVGPN